MAESKKHSSRNPTSPQDEIAANESRPDSRPKAPSEYVKGLDSRERVDMVLGDLYEKHRWTIKDLLFHMVTAEPTKKWAKSTLARSKNLSDAIYKQPEVTAKLSRASSDIHTFGSSALVTRIRAELSSLSKPDAGLGSFDPEMDIAELDISSLIERVREVAPELWQLLCAIMKPQDQRSPRDPAIANRGEILMITSILAHARTPIISNNLQSLIGIHLHSMGVKRRSLMVLAGLGITTSYWAINENKKKVADIEKRRIRDLASIFGTKLVICWDNFDYNQAVRHQTLREPAQHISATTGKICIGHYMPSDGLRKCMFRPEIELDPTDIYLAPGNQEDDVLFQSQEYWIAEAIRCTHREAVETLFADGSSTETKQPDLLGWPQFPSVERLPLQKTSHYSFGPFLENEGTVSGTYNVIDRVFQEELGYDSTKDFDEQLYLVYGDQKTVSLIQTVQRERAETEDCYDTFNWILSIPGLFHWRMNYMDMIHEIYSGSEHAALESTLYHNKNYLGCIQGHKSPFHHREEVALKAFDARVTAMFYHLLPSHVSVSQKNEVDNYIKKLRPESFLKFVRDIRCSLFKAKEQFSLKSKKEPEKSPVADYEFSAHAKFVQQVALYKSLKQAIKYADTGMIRRVLARCCLLFSGSHKYRYSFLSLYMTWLTHTKAASEDLQKAILANGLVNLSGAEDSWFEMDRLNEFLNLEMKTLLAARRTSTLETPILLRRAAAAASYCTDLKIAMETAFGEGTKGEHHTKDASNDIRSLAYQLVKSKSIRKYQRGRSSNFQPADILNSGVRELPKMVERFNKQMIEHKWDVEEPENIPPTHINVLDDIITPDGDIGDF